MITQSIYNWIGAGLTTALSGFGLGYELWSAFEGWAAIRWPSVMGVVTAARMEVRWIRRGGNVYEPCVSYSYEISGKSYSGERVRFGNTAYSFRSRAEASLAKYPIGGPVQVHYDPSRPDESVLELGVTPGTAFSVLFLIGMLVAGVYGLLKGWR